MLVYLLLGMIERIVYVIYQYKYHILLNNKHNENIISFIEPADINIKQKRTYKTYYTHFQYYSCCYCNCLFYHEWYHHYF